ncbi:hypothetical protein FACS189434_11710 [Bacteroidia bacterium]|nr:hypothetical protein FACS189434_11710 [Bacteroidia bacterium]
MGGKEIVAVKTREALRNEILRYADYAWQSDAHDLHPLTQLMVDELCNELYLLYGQLDNINRSVLDKLVKTLSPATYRYIRPAHAVLHLQPNTPVYLLDRKTTFFIKQTPAGTNDEHVNQAVFTPAADIQLSSSQISVLFIGNTLWKASPNGEKNRLFDTNDKAEFNTVWLGLDICEDLKTLENLCFYFQFLHLDDNHAYYDRMSDLQWRMGNKSIKVKQGIQTVAANQTEKEVLDYYKDRFQTVRSAVALSEITRQKLPEELEKIIPANLISSIPPLYWLAVTFPPHFDMSDLEKLKIALNVFPVINRDYKAQSFVKEQMSEVISLSSDMDEEFLEIEQFSDFRNKAYKQGHGRLKTYQVEPVPKQSAAANETDISDYLERLVDVVQQERAVFPDIDNEKIERVFNAVSTIQSKGMLKSAFNRLNKLSDVARLTVHTEEDTAGVHISYWTTLAEKANGIPAKTTLMAHKTPELNKSDAVLLSIVDGGKNQYDLESLRAINRFYLTAKDRILTKTDILHFCWMEIGKYSQDICVTRNVRISPKFKEGMINAIEIGITPLPEYRTYLQSGRAMKDLRIRLRQRSPKHFVYKTMLNN